MINQQTFKNTKPTIFLVGTPIGNLDDMSIRAIETLKNVDVIFCEDTRTSKKILTHFQIKKPLVSLHKFNEKEKSIHLNSLLKENKNIAIISDAGAPIISDPGAVVIDELNKMNTQFNLTSVNVGSAYVHALLNSRFLINSHFFYGFVQNKSQQSKTLELNTLINKYLSESVICLYESVHRIKSTITTLKSLLRPSHQICIARELTKAHEQIIIGNIDEIDAFCCSDEFVEKGEFVIIIGQEFNTNNVAWTQENLLNKINEYINQGYKLKQATKLVADLSNQSKNELYELYLQTNKTNKKMS